MCNGWRAAIVSGLVIVLIWAMRTAIAIILALALVPAAHAQEPHPDKQRKGRITRVAYEFQTSVKLGFEYEVELVWTRVPATCYVPARGTRVCNAFVPCRWARVPCAEQLRTWTETTWMNGLRYTMQVFLIGDLFGPGSCDRVDAGHDYSAIHECRSWGTQSGGARATTHSASRDSAEGEG